MPCLLMVDHTENCMVIRCSVNVVCWKLHLANYVCVPQQHSHLRHICCRLHSIGHLVTILHALGGVGGVAAPPIFLHASHYARAVATWCCDQTLFSWIGYATPLLPAEIQMLSALRIFLLVLANLNPTNPWKNLNTRLEKSLGRQFNWERI